jgi:hypothetical protein
MRPFALILCLLLCAACGAQPEASPAEPGPLMIRNADGTWTPLSDLPSPTRAEPDLTCIQVGNRIDCYR